VEKGGAGEQTKNEKKNYHGAYLLLTQRRTATVFRGIRDKGDATSGLAAFIRGEN